MKSLLSTVSTVLIMWSLFVSNASAHFMTVNVDNYYPGVGEEVLISIGMGHQFPEKESYEIEKMKKMYIIGPDGKQINLTMKPEGDKKLVAPIKMKFSKSGTYVVVAVKKNEFVCKTTEGYLHKPKKELQNVIKAFWTEGHAKAIIVVGRPSGDASQRSIDSRFQVFPLTDPGKLKKGGSLNASVTMDDKPVDTEVLATFTGFSAEKNAFAQKIKTDNGIAGIELSSSGTWLIKASHRIPYSNPEEADEHSFSSTVTFGVK